MQRAKAADAPLKGLWSTAISRVRDERPTLIESGAAFSSAIFLILAFPNFGLSLFAWIALAPLLIVLGRRPAPLRAFFLGWATGSIFFYGSCYWLTYSMIHYGGIPPVLAYLLLLPATLTVGLFPALFAVIFVFLVQRWRFAILLAPFIWVSCEWLRLLITGQLWNALGYSQAYFPSLIQTASWGGVYAVGLLIVACNSAIATAVVIKTRKALATSGLVIVGIAALVSGSFLINFREPPPSGSDHTYLDVVGVQPNVPMALVKSTTEMKELFDRHIWISINGLRALHDDQRPKLVIWPESPMNFTYTSDTELQGVIMNLTQQQHTSLLINSLEPAPNNGGFNSALLINEEGRLISQYDKIRLMPFGEYVPLPSWLGGSLISGLVGDFTAGDKYTVMPIANHRAGVFICIESAYPTIARQLTANGADMLINISNDGYLGPTAVMRQHLANAIFRAVENGRPVLRVTNSGITAEITPNGNVKGPTQGFVAGGRVWSISDNDNRSTLYTKFGDLFVGLCALITIAMLLKLFLENRRSLRTK